jgi:hypothetical protein
MKTTTPRTLAALKLPLHVPDLIKVAQAIVEAMTGNAALPNPTPTLAVLNAAIAALDAAETATKTRAKGTIEVRNNARAALIAELHELKGYVQTVCDANLTQAGTIITSAAMSVKKPPVHTKHDFVAKSGAVSGSVHLVAKAVSRRASYEWQWSPDGGKTWTQSPSTLQSRTTILGLPLAVTCQFRYRAVTKVGEGDWSQVITFLVK